MSRLFRPLPIQLTRCVSGCSQCWRKYARPYTSAIAHSWPTLDQQHNPDTTSQAQNYQRPLVLNQFTPSPAAAYTSPPPGGVVLNHSSVRPGLIERGGQQNRGPRLGPPAPPPGVPGRPPFPLPEQYGPPPPQLQNMYGQGPLRVLPGDPRIGGMYVSSRSPRSVSLILRLAMVQPMSLLPKRRHCTYLLRARQ